MKVFAWIWFVLFLLFAAVQFNDPDPEVWVPVYLYAAVTSFLMARRKIIAWMIIIGMLGYFAGAVYWFTPNVFSAWIEQEMANRTTDMKTEIMEEGREFWGLFICFIVHVAYMFKAIARKKIAIG